MNPEPAFVPSVPGAAPGASSDRLDIRSTSKPLMISQSPLLTTASPSSGVSTAPRVLTHPFAQRIAKRPHPDGSFGKGTGTVIVLFRGDLRVHDHPALTHALEEAATVIPVYVFDTRHFGSSPAGFQRTGKYRARFQVESVAALRSKLEALGSGLIVRVGIPEQIVPELARQTRCKRVFVHKEINVEEISVEKKLTESLQKTGSKLQKFWSNTLYYEEDLPFSITEMPDIYTDFRENVDTRSQIRDPLPAPESLTEIPRSLEKGKLPTLSQLGINDTFDGVDSPAGNMHAPDGNGVGTIIGGEDEALRRLRDFAVERKHSRAEHMGSYKNGNENDKSSGVHTPDFACKISPWLALGCLSPRIIFDEMKRCSARPVNIKSSYTYYELVWRDFFRCITAKYSAKRIGNTSGTKVAV